MSVLERPFCLFKGKGCVRGRALLSVAEMLSCLVQFVLTMLFCGRGVKEIP